MKDDKRLKRKVRNSYFVSTVSIALVLFLLGSVGYLMVVAMQMARTLGESVTVTVELCSDLDERHKEELRSLFEADELVCEVVYSSKEEKINDPEFREMCAQEFEAILEENPLFDSFDLSLAAGLSDRTTLDSFTARIEATDGVERISYPVQTVDRLHTTVSKIRLVLLLFGGALLVISLILLSNTIRLAIFSKRYLINTMKLVGASRWFIMRPFLASSIGQGILSGVIASALFLAATYGLSEAVPELLTLAQITEIAIIAGAMTLGGVLISLCFTLFAVRKFVRMKSNKIYLY
jgi:cell division transport system permease protein